MKPRSAVVELALLSGMCVVAGLEYRSVFSLSAVLFLVVGAAVVPVALGWGLRRLRRATTLALVGVNLLAWLLFVSGAVFTEASLAFIPTPETVRGLVEGLRDGWAQILSTTLPAPNEPTMLVLVPTATWLAALLASELSVRTRSLVAPTVPVVILFGSALAFAVDGVVADAWVLGVLGASWVLLVAVRNRSEGSRAKEVPVAQERGAARASDRPARVRVAQAVVVLTVAAVLGSALGPGLPFARSRDPLDPRRYRLAPVEPSQVVNPLSQIPALLTDADRELFSVQAERAGLWRLVVLDTFDGRTWASSSRFDSAGNVLRAYAPGGDTSSLEQEFRISALPGVWLPAADRPVEFQGPAVRFDRETGALAIAGGTIGDVRYEVESETPVLRLSDLTSARTPSDPSFDRFRTLPGGLPEPIRTFAKEVTRGATTPLEKALLIEDRLSSQFRFNPQVTGHSYGHVRFFLTVSGEGSSEQFASAFAVLARAVGLPARISVGFRPGQFDERRKLFTVRGSDAFAWPEVYFRGVGWVPFDPEPVRAAGSLESEGIGLAEVEAKEEITIAAKRNAQLHRGQDGAATQPSTGDGPEPWLLVASAVVIVAVGAVLWRVRRAVQRRRLRRRRRGAPSAREQIVGAWNETRDRLVRIEPEGVSARSPAELVGWATDQVGEAAGQALEPLSSLATSALYDRRSPSLEDAVEAWRLELLVARALKSKPRGVERAHGDGVVEEDRAPM